MRTYSHYEGHEDFWPAYTDILMATSLILILLVITFVISTNTDYTLEEQKKRKTAFIEQFQAGMAAEIQRGLIRITNPPGERQTITFSEQLLFDTGKADLNKPAGLHSLDRLTGLLKRSIGGQHPLFKTVKVNGHTDEDPIQTVEFPSNWHLSSARATSVVYFFAKHGIPPTCLSATGYAEFQPFDPYGKPLQDKARKRRIDVELLYPIDWITDQLNKKA